MTLTAADFDTVERGLPDDGTGGPRLDEQPWGYVIHDGAPGEKVRAVGGATARFFGVILLLAATGLWILPDGIYGAEVFGIKIAAMVMFSVFGGYFLWAGGAALQPVFEVDLTRREIRIGVHGTGGGFQQRSQLDFDLVGSVFLLRSKDHRKTRLFLRLGDVNEGLEIAAGSAHRMEALKSRLAQDLSEQTKQPVQRRLWRHQTLAC